MGTSARIEGSVAGALHALDAAAAAGEVADEGSGEVVGGFDLYAHDGFEERGAGGFHAFAEGEAGGHFEGHFAGVYVVVAAVEDGDLDVDYGVSGEEAAGGGFADAFFYGGDVLAGDGSAEDVVDELDAGAAGEGFDAELAVAELAVASGLFLVAALGFGAAEDGFAVGDFGGFEDDVGVVAAFEFGDDGFDVGLAGAGDEELAGLGVAVEADHGVVFHELVEGGGEFVLVGAGAWARWRRSWRARAWGRGRGGSRGTCRRGCRR